MSLVMLLAMVCMYYKNLVVPEFCVAKYPESSSFQFARRDVDMALCAMMRKLSAILHWKIELASLINHFLFGRKMTLAQFNINIFIGSSA
jgi:hypothetical protein